VVARGCPGRRIERIDRERIWPVGQPICSVHRQQVGPPDNEREIEHPFQSVIGPNFSRGAEVHRHLGSSETFILRHLVDQDLPAARVVAEQDLVGRRRRDKAIDVELALGGLGHRSWRRDHSRHAGDVIAGLLIHRPVIGRRSRLLFDLRQDLRQHRRRCRRAHVSALPERQPRIAARQQEQRERRCSDQHEEDQTPDEQPLPSSTPICVVHVLPSHFALSLADAAWSPSRPTHEDYCSECGIAPRNAHRIQGRIVIA